MKEQVKNILDSAKSEFLNKHIPEMSALVTNKMTDVYELGINKGMEIGELIMLNKVTSYLRVSGYSEDLINSITINVKE